MDQGSDRALREFQNLASETAFLAADLNARSAELRALSEEVLSKLAEARATLREHAGASARLAKLLGKDISGEAGGRCHSSLAG